MSRKVPDIEKHIVWHSDGRYSPTCELCGWEGKPRWNHADTRAAVFAHQRTKRHSENTNRASESDRA